MGGRGGRSTKKNSRKGKLNEKNSCTPINPKKYSCYGLKKIHTRNLITKKISCGSKIPLPPSHKFSNGPSLRIPDFRSYISTIAACFYLAAAEGPDKVFREKLAEE